MSTLLSQFVLPSLSPGLFWLLNGKELPAMQETQDTTTHLVVVLSLHL